MKSKEKRQAFQSRVRRSHRYRQKAPAFEMRRRSALLVIELLDGKITHEEFERNLSALEMELLPLFSAGRR